AGCRDFHSDHAVRSDRVIFLRHPVTDAPEGMCYGRSDVGLGHEAPSQIEAALMALPTVGSILCSPARRCRLLAERFVQRDGASLRFDERLWEHDFGDWEGRLWSDIPRAESEAWMEDLWNNASPGGERYRDVVKRVGDALADADDGDVVICHAGVIRAAQILIEGRSFDEVFAIKVPFATPIRIARKAA
ncbi:MAG: histidine phosphatase family protein, partial [Pseudomonadota bacterium]